VAYSRVLSNQAAVEAVCSSGAQRNPCEASGGKTLDALLDACRNYGVKVKKGARQSPNQKFLYPEIHSRKRTDTKTVKKTVFKGLTILPPSHNMRQS